MMAWEMQQHMFSYIRPSIDQFCKDHCSLVELYVETCVDGALDGKYVRAVNACWHLSREAMIDAIASLAETNATTTNGAFRFYVDDHTTIPWCTEEEYQEYWS